MMKRIVCDTNVLISGLLWKGAPHRLLVRVENGDLVMFTSRDLLGEASRVMDYPRLRIVFKKAGLTRNQAMRWIVRNSTLVLSKPIGNVVEEDPSDDHVLACAVAASADAVVSGDEHLLSLGKFQGIPILKVAAFLDRSG